MAPSELVATLIAGAGAKISLALLQKLARQTEEAGAQSVRTAWLAEEKAADIFFTGPDAADFRQRLQSAIAAEPADIIVQPAAGRRKKLLVADMESTIIEQELLDELAGEIGMRDRVAAITRRAMNGEIDFGAALHERLALFKGKPASILEKVARGITFMPGAAELLATMKANGATAWLVTGGLSFFAQPAASRLGFDACHANELIIENGVMTGEASAPILDRNRKKTLLEQACAGLKLSIADSLCVGDGANDVPMLTACANAGGLGIAFHARPGVREVVPHRIDHADLTALLYAQGYGSARWKVNIKH